MKTEASAFLVRMGALFRARREETRISQKDLSELTGLSVHTISDIEGGKGNPTIEVLLRLCEYLGLRIAIEPGKLESPEAPE